MFQTAKTKILAVSLGALLLSSLVAAGVMAASDQAGPRPGGVELIETPEASETAEPTEAQEPTETEEPTEPSDAAETPEAGETLGDNEQSGVSPDSPACAGDLDHPNPHDTDGDGEGCREVQMPDGTVKNLPDPAADAHEGNPGIIGHGHGRPTGEPPFGSGHGQGPHGNDADEEDDAAGSTAAAP